MATLTNPSSLDSDYGMSGQYLATWRAIRDIINLRGRDTAEVDQEVKDALDSIEAGNFDPARIDALIARLDAITTPDSVQLPPQPGIGTINHTPVALPPINRTSPVIPTTPGDRALMDFGAVPSLQTSGDPTTMQDYRNLLLAERDALLAMVQDKFQDFVNEFLPTGAYDDAVSWLRDAIHARNTGIPVQVEAQLHERNRARIHKETARQVSTATVTWASKGYTLPPGALVSTVNDLRRQQLEQLSTASRELTIYVTDKHIENARFAVEQSLGLRGQTLGAALDYMKTLIVSPQQAGDWLSAMIDNRTKIAQAQADIFKTRAGVATDVFRTQTSADMDKFKTGADVTLEDSRQNLSSQVEVFRARLAQEQQVAGFALEQFKARTGTDLEAYKVASGSLLQYYEAETRMAAVKADVIGKTADTAIKLEELKFGRENQIAKMRVDVAMERLKTYAQQASAALNNLQLSAGSSTSYVIQTRNDDD